MREERPLAAVVPKAETEAAIASLRAEGVHDDGRHVREHDPDHVAVPVTDPPSETAVREVVEQVDPDYRNRDLASLLRDRGFTESEVAAAPSSWAVVGSVLLADFEGCERREAVGEALLSLHGEADTVLDDRGVSGVRREPDVEVVAGSGDTETVHVEHGTRYALDLSSVMFSPGNKAERARVGEAVAADDRVLDAFAGVGYFTLPMARAGAAVTAVEVNPDAFRYLLENAALNGVRDRIDAYRGDCREVVPDLGVRFDRAVLGHFDALDPGGGYLGAVVPALAPGARLHCHAAVPEAELPGRPLERVKEGVAAAGRDVASAEVRRVKTYSEGVVHAVVDATLE